MKDESLIKYPCEFPIKAIGKDEHDFVSHVLNLIAPHYPEINENNFHTRPSKDGNYISVTVTITATSREQLDAIYTSLTDSKQVIMAL